MFQLFWLALSHQFVPALPWTRYRFYHQLQVFHVLLCLVVHVMGCMCFHNSENYWLKFSCLFVCLFIKQVIIWFHAKWRKHWRTYCTGKGHKVLTSHIKQYVTLGFPANDENGFVLYGRIWEESKLLHWHSTEILRTTSMQVLVYGIVLTMLMVGDGWGHISTKHWKCTCRTPEVVLILKWL